MLGHDVAARAAQAGHELVGVDRAGARHHRRRRRACRRGRRCSPRRSSTARPGRTLTAPRPQRDCAQPSMPTAPATSRGRRPRSDAPLAARLHRLRLRRRRSARRRRTYAPLCRVRSRRGPARSMAQSKLAGEQLGARGLAAPYGRAQRLAVRRATGTTSSTRCCALPTSARRSQVVDDQVGSPDLDGAPRAGAARAARARRAAGSCTWPARGAVTWNGFAQEIFRQAERSTVACEPATSDADGAPCAAARLLGAGQRARRCPADARLARRARRLSCGASWDDARMRLLVCGGAGFIGSNFVRLRLREHGDEMTSCSTSSPMPGARRTFTTSPTIPRFRFVHGGDRGPRGGRRGDRSGLPRRSSTSPPRPTSTARSPSPTPSSRTHALGTYVLLEAARERGLRYLQVSTDEVYGSIDEGTFTEDSPLRPSSPYSATKTGADLLVAQLLPHLRPAGRRSAAARTTTGPTSTPRS